MHPEILEDKKGSCPICKMDLVPIRLDSVWTCGTRPLAVIKDGPGRCPIDGTALVQVTAAISWGCAGGNEESVSPGTCPDGSPMQKKYASRAHGNHNPQHGGLFFMASDNTHHLEGAYLPSGVFRMYFYDEFTKPQKPAGMKDTKATLVVKDSRTGKDATYSLVRSGSYLQASIGKLPLPAEMYANVKFAPGGKDNRFDFTFPAYSKEPHGTPTATMTSAAPAPTGAAPAATAAPSASASPAGTETASGVDAALVPLPIPDTVPEMLEQLRTRTDQIKQFIDRGSFASIYVPAFQAKDLALALEAHKNDMPPERRKLAEPAFSKLVRSAWLLDAFGDIGNKQQISEAYSKFVEAAKDIQSAFPKQP
jgi:Heavy metal binding domain